MKKKRKKKREGVWSGFLALVLGLAILILAFLLLFHIQKIEVTGNSYTSETEIVNWLKKDKYTSNSAYVWWKYRHTQMKDLPLVEGADISLKNPWTIRIRVYETSIIGYLELNGKYIYFDKDGVVALIADLESVDGVPKIEGINLTTADVKAHKVLPVEDTEIFDSVLTVTSEVKKQELSPDRIVFEGKDVTLYFGQITALLGSGKLDEKIAQIPPIQEKLSGTFWIMR